MFCEAVKQRGELSYLINLPSLYLNIVFISEKFIGISVNVFHSDNHVISIPFEECFEFFKINKKCS